MVAFKKNHNATTLLKQAQFLASQGKDKKDEALSILESVLKTRPENEAIIAEAALLASQLQQTSLAINLFLHLVNLNPDNAAYPDQLAAAYIMSGDSNSAIHFLNQALALDPENPSALINMGAACNGVNQFKKAVEYLEKARKSQPSNPALLVNLATALNNIGRTEDALNIIELAAKVDSKNPSTLYTIGMLNAQLGKYDIAQKYYRKSIKLNPTYGASYYGLSAITKFTAEHSSEINEAVLSLKESMASVDRSLIEFYLGKAYNDLRKWDKAFEYYRHANLLRKFEFDNKDSYTAAKKAKDFSLKKMKDIRHSTGNNSDIPVFIIGMPRSGSTLVEQIITCLPGAGTVGESKEIQDMVSRIFLPTHKSRQEIVSLTSNEQLKQYADDYLAMLMNNNPDCTRIINKAPGNFAYLGFIRVLFPKARFIHTTRHPLDTALSCYFQSFTYIKWAFDLDQIADFYRYYRQSMSFWESYFPPGTIISVDYNSLVENPETESRRLADACGLTWTPDCLEFFKQDRHISTSSLWQVRQPIYQTSKQRWRNYGRHLGELAKNMKEYLQKDDIAFLNDCGIQIRADNFLQKFAKKLLS